MSPPTNKKPEPVGQVPVAQRAVAQKPPPMEDLLEASNTVEAAEQVAPEQAQVSAESTPAEIAHPRQIVRVTLPGTAVRGLAMTDNGSFIAADGSGQQFEYRQRGDSWRAHASRSWERPVTSLSVSAYGTAAGFEDGLQVRNSRETSSTPMHVTPFSQTGWLAACNDTHHVLVWGPRDSAPIAVDINPRTAHRAAWVAEGELLVAGEHRLQRVGLSGPKAIETQLSGSPIELLQVSTASRIAAVVQRGADRVSLLDTTDLTDTGLRLSGASECTVTAFTSDGGYLLIGDASGFLSLYRLLDSALVERWRAHPGPVTALAFSPDNARVGSGSESGEVAIWRVHETRPSLPVLKSDLDHGDDALAIDRDVRAFTRVILARELHPPMAIGIFGDWGTGKSFFLGRMRTWIDREGERARSLAGEGEPMPYVAHTAQITFNAWHYLEGNLWASMMAHLFDELGKHVRPEEPAAKTRRDLIMALETTQVAKRAAKERRVAVEKRLAEVRERERAARERLERERTRQAQLRDSDILPMAGKVLYGTLERKTERLRGDAGKQVDAATAEWRRTLASLRTTRGRLWMMLKWAWQSKRLAVVLVLVVGLGALGALVAREVGLTSDNILFALSTALGPIAVLGQSAARAWRAVEQPLDAALDHLEEHRTNLDAANEERIEKALEPLSADLERATAEMHSAETDLQRIKASYDRVNLELDAAQAAIADADEGRRLLRFLGERADTSDYRRHLGTISLIKRDLDTLADFLCPQIPADTEPDTPAVSDRDRAHIDRIVLYIDDLDRCPPKRVVEVLQAVHLLLGMRLFVVVVAVDSRWLMRSLDEHYADLLGDDETGEIRRSTPHNYLEKIFQIPYVLSPMDKHGFGRLVTGLAAPQDREATGALIAEPAQSSALQAPADAASDAPGAGADPDEVRLDELRRAQAPISAEAARLTEGELRVMRELHPLIATPRAVKAFVNIYRLVRARLEEPRADEPSLATYLREGEYVLALLMLAIQVGRSRQAGLLYADLASEDRPADIDLYIAKRIVVTRKSDPLAFEHPIAGPLTDNEAESWQLIADRMRFLRTLGNLPDKTAPYALWAGRMRRFSFDPWRRIDDRA